MCWVVFPRPPPASLLGLEVTPRMKEERLAKINNAFHGFVIFFQIDFEFILAFFGKNKTTSPDD